MKYLFTLLVLVFITTSCDPDSIFTKRKNHLPPETQIGANTAGCLINGNVFLPYQEGQYPSLTCTYNQYQGVKFFGLTIRDSRGKGVKSIYIDTLELTLEAGQIIPLNKHFMLDQNFTGGAARYNINNVKYYTDSENIGELKITKVDFPNGIIAGTFWFDAKNSEGETVTVRDGRFDMEFY